MYTTDTNTKVVEFLNRAQTKLGQAASLVADKAGKGIRFDSHRDDVKIGFELHSFVLALDNNWNDWTEDEVVQYIDKWSAKAKLNLTPYFEHDQYNLHISFDAVQITELPSLPLGYFWLGNANNVAAAVTFGGAISVDENGNVTINNTVIDNTNISTTANISLTKLESVTAGRVIISNASTGFLEASSISTTILGYIGNLTSDAQTQIDAKEPTLTKGDLTESTSSVLTITGGSSSIIGSGVSIQVKLSGASQSGYLSSTDWNTFNNKLGGSVGNLAEVTSSVLTITGGSNAVLGTGASIQVKQAGASQSGYLSSTDWNTFNNKLGGLGESSWTALTLINSWTATGGEVAPSYRKDAFGIVHLRGGCSNASDVSTAAFTLPSGYRPTAQVRIPSAAQDSSFAFGYVTISTAGNITGASVNRMWLDGITFYTT